MQTGKWLENHYTTKVIDHEQHNFRLDEHPALLNNHHIVGRLFKSELIRKNNIKFSTIRKSGEDVLFAFYTAFYAERLSMVPQIIAYFYCLGKYIAKANEEKLFNARDNVLETMDFVKKKCDNQKLQKAMMRKGAIFVGDLTRAAKVYEKSEEKFKAYLATLVPFVEGITDEIKNSLPSYNQFFTNALLLRDFTGAHLFWTHRSHLTAQLVSAASQSHLSN